MLDSCSPKALACAESVHGFGTSAGQRLPIDPCSRNIVRQLRADGYPLDYLEFDGEHTIPPEAARAAVDLLCADAGAT